MNESFTTSLIAEIGGGPGVRLRGCCVCLPQVSADPGCSGDAELLFLFI